MKNSRSRIVRIDADYERYMVNEDARAYIQARVLPRFSPDEISGLTRAARIIADECGASHSHS